jgi:outer membrane protein OmpA-like peptidoglycan-associated protein
VGVLREHPDARIEVSGFTDDRGGEDVNTRLSRERADVVRWYLVDRGIAPERIITRGLGSARPVGSNEDEAGRARNRRIEFRICDERCSP